MTDRPWMKPFLPLLGLLSLTLLPLWSDDRELSGAEEAPRSPEGAQDLDKLHKILMSALKDGPIERRFLALNKIRQLAPDELSLALVSAVVESMDGDNHNYLWFAAHTLKRISGRDLGIAREAWREWVRKEYEAPVAQPKTTAEAARMGSGSVGHDNSGGTPALDVPPSDKLGHDPNIKVVEDKPKSDSGKETMEPRHEEKVPDYEPSKTPEDKGPDSKP